MDISATWDALDSADTYKLRWRLVDGEFEAGNAATVSETNATVTVPEPGEWEVQLQGCNDAGCGPLSVQKIEVTTPCGDGVIVPSPADNPELVADCEALWAARDVLNPAGDVLASWNANTALGDWRGVTVGGDPVRVNRLDLATRYLKGSIPAILGRLTGLTWLQLERNDLTGEIPPELGNLTKLTELSVSYNRLTGSAPASLANLTDMTHIHLNNNQLTGPIPSEYGNLNTEHFHLSFNKFTGSIPPELGNIDELGGLFLDNNELTGEIPEELKNPETIHTFALQNNQLSGELPDWIGSQWYWYLFLNGNDFTGSIPDLSGLSNLSKLKLGENLLTGCITDSLRSRVTTPYSSIAPYGEVGAPFCADGSLEE